MWKICEYEWNNWRKYGGDAVVEWTVLICERAWKKGEVPDGWKIAIIVPLYKGKGSRSEARCKDKRGRKRGEGRVGGIRGEGNQ